MSAYFKLPHGESQANGDSVKPEALAPTPTQAAIIAAPAFKAPDVLTRREREVCDSVASGLSNKEVADQLFVTEKTIKFHLTSIYKKLQIKSRSQLIVHEMKRKAASQVLLPNEL